MDMGLPPKGPMPWSKCPTHNYNTIFPKKGELSGGEDQLALPTSPDANSSSEEGGVVIASSKNEAESNMDPKKMKRILANRLSAQRSRVKKLVYISQHEKRITELEAEIGLFTPQVEYYDNQRRMLNMENNVMKQRIAFLIHEKVLKDAQFQTLRQDLERLRRLSQQQEQQQQQQPQQMMGFEQDQTQNMNMREDLSDFIYD